MKYDTEKVDDMILALMTLTFFEDEFSTKTWKGFDWGSLNRLYEKKYISDPVGKAKSVTLTPEGLARAKELFEKYFGKK